MENVEHWQDAKTKAGRIIQPVERPDAAPRDPNPIRRFREELRLTREAFAETVGIPVETLRAWEREFNAVVPSQSRMATLIELARRNYYPLLLVEIIRYAETKKRKKKKS